MNLFLVLIEFTHKNYVLNFFKFPFLVTKLKRARVKKGLVVKPILSFEMTVSSEQFYQAFRERFPTKQTLVLAKIEEIKAFLLNFNQSQENEPTEKSKLEKMTHNNWLSRYYLKEIGETFYVFYASNNRRMVSC
jgi:DNA repair photolyase